MSQKKVKCSMKAVVVRQFGDASVLRVEDVPMPTFKPGEVLVRVHGVAVDRMDLTARQGKIPGLRLPRILGGDLSGVITKVGDGVSNWREGDRVVCYPLISCGQCMACRMGMSHLCQTTKWVGLDIDGGYAEYVALPMQCLVRVPAEVDLITAATLPMAYTTAYHALFEQGQLRPKETVAIFGATGGVGLAAVHLALYRGAKVVAVASSKEKLIRLQAVAKGDVFAIPYEEQDVVETLSATIGEKGIDVVLDMMGQRAWKWCSSFLSVKGRYVSLGVPTGLEISVNLRNMFQSEITLVGSYFGTKEELEYVLQLVKEKKLPPLTDEIFDLSTLFQAHQKLEARLNLGRYLIRVLGGEE